MARSRSRTSPLPLVAALILFIAAAVLQLMPGRPFQLGPLLLDDALQIAAGSELPSPLLHVGDRVIEVDGVAVGTTRGLAAVLSAQSGAEVPVVIDRATQREVRSVSLADLGSGAPALLDEGATVVSIDGAPVSGRVGVDELRFFAQQASPVPLAVEIEVGGALEGPVTVSRGRAAVLGVAWLVLTLLGAGASLLLSARGPTALAGGETARLLAIVLSGLAAGAATAPLVEPMSPLWIGAWSVALAVAARGAHLMARLGELNEESDPVYRWASAGLAGAAALGALWVMWSVGRGEASQPLALVRQLELAGLGVIAAYALAELVAMRGAGDGWVSRVGSVGALAVTGAAGIGALVSPDLLEMGLTSAALVGVSAASWVGQLPALAGGDLAARRVRGESGEESGAVAVLRAAASAAGGREVAFAVGLHGEIVLARGVDRHGGGVDGIAAAMAPSVLSDALAMLATEGGMFPRAEGDDEIDAFAGLASRIGLAAAVPLQAGAEEHAIDGFLLVFDSPEGTAWDPAEVAALLDQSDVNLLYSELGVVASAELIAESRRRSGASAADRQPADRPASDRPAPESRPLHAPVLTAPTRAVPAASLAPAPTPVSDARVGRWASWLEHNTTAEYCVDDPDVLTDAERRALSYLSNSDGAVLLVGEPGVGKEFMARVIHHESVRSSERFVSIDCSLLPAAVVEIELFGDDETPGLVDIVGRGSLLLKAASSLPRSVLDAVLSRLDTAGGRLFVAERYRGPDVGVPETVPPAVRRRVANRTLHLAPLRDRPRDVERYARLFLHREAMRYDFVTGGSPDGVGIDRAALDTLCAHDLPSNFGDLQALVRAAFLRSQAGAVSAVDLEPGSTRPGARAPARRATGASPAVTAPLQRAASTTARTPAAKPNPTPAPVAKPTPATGPIEVPTPVAPPEAARRPDVVAPAAPVREPTPEPRPEPVSDPADSLPTPPAAPVAPVAPVVSVGDGEAPIGDEEDAEPTSEAERASIVAALRDAAGNRTLAAQRLGVTRGKLLRRLKKYGI